MWSARDGESRQLIAFALWMVVVLTAAAVLLLVARRLTGGFQRPLDDSGLLAWAVVGASLAGLFRLVASRCGWSPLALLVAPSALLLPFAAVLSPGVTMMGLVMLWSVVLAEEAICWLTLFKKRPPAAPVAEIAAIELPDPPAVDASLETLPEGVTQQVTRSVDEEGAETLWALVRIEFREGERTKNAHVAFCPPFDCVPTLYLEHLDGDEASVRATQVEAFGVRLELRLAKTCQTRAEAVIQVIATCEPAAAEG